MTLPDVVTKNFHFHDIPKDLHLRWKVYAAHSGRDMNEILIAAIHEYLGKNEIGATINAASAGG